MKFPDFEVLQNRGLFLILDGARMDALRFVYEHDDCPEVDVLYRGTPHEPVIEVSPCIVRLSENSGLWRGMNNWKFHGVAIESDADIHTLGNHLRSLISVRLPDGVFAYLRFYSPSQIAPLFSSFSNQEAARFSGPVARWHYFAPTEGWKTVEALGKSESQEASYEGWFQLREKHLRAIESGNEIVFREKLVHQAGWPVTTDSMSRIDKIVLKAQSFGFKSQRDIATYAELACYYGERMDEPNARAVLSSEDKPAEQRLAEIDSMMSYGDA